MTCPMPRPPVDPEEFEALNTKVSGLELRTAQLENRITLICEGLLLANIHFTREAIDREANQAVRKKDDPFGGFPRHPTGPLLGTIDMPMPEPPTKDESDAVHCINFSDAQGF